MKNILMGLLLPAIVGVYMLIEHSKYIEVKQNVSKSGTMFLDDEVRPEKGIPCFNGAFYRKAVSSKDVWVGISGTVVLPKITFDPSRKNTQKPGQFLDNPSVYMGGNMNGQETDVGMTWEVIRDESGNVSSERKAFRPFFRRVAYKKTGQKSRWQDAPASKEYYWYPGEEIKMSVRVVSDGKLRFTVEGAGKRYEADFETDGYKMDGIGEFKRVNAIDQVRNEGKAAQPTKTRVENAVWKETNLFRMQNGKVIQVPLHKDRFTDMRCPDQKFFNIKANKRQQKVGSELINIDGSAE
jgi:hypothetical protein